MYSIWVNRNFHLERRKRRMRHLFAVGYRGDGQLAEAEPENDDGQCFTEAVEIQDAPEDIRMIACGLKHTLFLTDDGEMYSVGNNECGQLGRDVFQDGLINLYMLK